MMYYKISTKMAITTLAILSIIIIITAYLAAGSLNPLDVYATDNLLAKILLIIFAFFILNTIANVLYYTLLGKAIGFGSNDPGEDRICPGCGHPLIAFSGSHGWPIPCPRCGAWWHNGPACYNKGMSNPTIVTSKYPCPKCRSTIISNEDLFDDEIFANPKQELR